MNEGLDEDLNIFVILCDLTKAFDCVDTQTLLLKFRYNGILGNMLDLFSSYLLERKPYIVNNNVEKSPKRQK